MVTSTMQEKGLLQTLQELAHLLAGHPSDPIIPFAISQTLVAISHSSSHGGPGHEYLLELMRHHESAIRGLVDFDPVALSAFATMAPGRRSETEYRGGRRSETEYRGGRRSETEYRGGRRSPPSLKRLDSVRCDLGDAFEVASLAD